MSKLLSEIVNVERQFIRSIRIDSDLGRPDALAGYVCQGTALNTLQAMSSQILNTHQRAFTWTGPYGGGKSSLGLALCSLVHGDPKVRESAKKALGIRKSSHIYKAFNADKGEWLTLPLQGSRESVIEKLKDNLNKTTGTNARKNPRSLIDALVSVAESEKYAGILVLLDEMGKFLEYSANNNEDIFFYQDLAEAASRCKGKIVIVGLLHQTFDQYATKLGREIQNEWAKVQGRFVDLPMNSTNDEVIQLISAAIKSDTKPSTSFHKACSYLSDSIRSRRKLVPASIEQDLVHCWPLHPTTAALLGPISRKRFGQNERSIFGFLTSAEPRGFQEFLKSTRLEEEKYFTLSDYWDYLKTNLEPAILSSPDGHRWAQAAEAVERTESRSSELQIRLVKTIALLDLFRENSGVGADDNVLKSPGLIADSTDKGIDQALSDLKKWSVLVFRKHLNSWGIFAGSDFDIDSAVTDAQSQILLTTSNCASFNTDLSPVIAKEHYWKTGSLRWMTRSIVLEQEAEDYIAKWHPKADEFGEFVLVLPDASGNTRAINSLRSQLSNNNENSSIAIGIPSNSDAIKDLLLELSALERVASTYPELDGDSVARKEIKSRISTYKNQLEENIEKSFSSTKWVRSTDSEQSNEINISKLCSLIAEEVFSKCPSLRSELVNRNKISSPAAKAKRELMYRMLKHSGYPDLGYEGFTADAGIFHSLLRVNGIYRLTDKDPIVHGFTTAAKSDQTTNEFWEFSNSAIKKIFAHRNDLSELYKLWKQPPFGLKEGVLDILALALFLANRDKLALYDDGVFSPELNELIIDEWINNPARISWQIVDHNSEQHELIKDLHDRLGKLGIQIAHQSSLGVARGLVAFAYSLPEWTKRTQKIGITAKKLRALLLKASDPNKLLLTDLPTLFASSGRALSLEISNALEELSTSYPKMISEITAKVMKALDHRSSVPEKLSKRAKTIAGTMGDYRLEAFVTRLSEFKNTLDDIEGLISLALNKSKNDWTDIDLDNAVNTIASWSLDFRKAETMASIHDKSPTRHSIAILLGMGAQKAVTKSVDVSEDDMLEIEKLSESLTKHFRDLSKKGKLSNDILLAALVKANQRIIEESA